MSLDVSLYQRKCPCCGHETEELNEFYDSNITHNLGKMAAEAGIYEYLWRPEEKNIKLAKELIEPLSIGLEDLKSNPEHYEQFNSPNGWGMYEHFVPFVEKYLEACKEYPNAEVHTDR